MISHLKKLLAASALCLLLSVPAHADVAPCGRCTMEGRRPSKRAMVGAGLLAMSGIAGLMLMRGKKVRS